MRRQHRMDMDLLRTTTGGRSLLACVLTMALLASALFSPTAFAQDSGDYLLPEDWQSLSADEFVALSQSSWDKVSYRQRTVLTNHAWSQFLSKPGFVAGDWGSVKPMIDFYAPRASNNKVKAKLLIKKLAELGQVTGSSFDETAQLTQSLGPKADVGPIWARWMQENRWDQLPFRKQVFLLEGSSYNGIDRFNMSARWTGSVAAPRNGDYSFLLVRGAFGDSQYKLSVNGKVVFDSAVSAAADGEEFLRSDLASLRREEAVPFELEMSYSQASAAKGPTFPMAALMWESDKVSRELIPSSAFTPPEGFGDGEPSGLKAQYFGDSKFGKLVTERLDANLEFAWNASPVVPIHDQYAKLIAGCRKVDIAKQFRKLKAGDKAELSRVLKAVSVLMKRLPLSERAELLSRLSKQKNTLKRVSPYWAGVINSGAYFLPGGEGTEFLDAWSQAREMPHFRPGDPRGKPRGLYRQTSKLFEFSHNWEFHWSIGRFFVGPHWADAEELLDMGLQRPDGQCDLTIAYIVSLAAFDNTRRGNVDSVAVVRKRIDEQLASDALSGNKRVSWLIAKSFLEEAAISHPPAWLAGREYLQEASLVAESDEYKFWVLQEQACRLVASGQEEALSKLLDSRGASFNDPAQVKAMQYCREAVKFYAQKAAEIAEAAERSGDLQYINGLQVRIDAAQKRGDSSAVSRLEKFMADARGKLQEAGE